MNNKFTNNNFYGKINKKNATYYYNEIKKIKSGTSKERIDKIHEILETEFVDDKEFNNTFWRKVTLQNDDEGYEGGVKLVLNKTDSLYSDSNIAMVLELAGTVILKGEKKKDNPEDYIRVFHSKELFLKELNEYEKFKNVVNSTNDGKYALVNGLGDYFILANQMNYKFEKKWTELDDKHLKKLDDKYGEKYPQAHDYYVSYVNMKKLRKSKLETLDLKTASFEEKRNIKIITKNIRTLKEDFIECLHKKIRFIVFKMPLPDKGEVDYDLVDEKNKIHVKALLRVNRGSDMQDDLSVIVKDLETTISSCELNKLQLKIIRMLKTDDTLTEIANKLDISIQLLNGYIDTIV